MKTLPRLEFITSQIVHLRFKTQTELTRTLIRFQEHYESPKFKGKIFTLAEYRTWYMGHTGRKTFTYYRDWSGFNFPSSVVDVFRSGDFNPLSVREKKILKLLPNIPQSYYVIATYDENPKKDRSETLNHEIAHGLYHTNRKYRTQVRGILQKYTRSEVMADLESWITCHYDESVWLDELHAYLATSLNTVESFGIDTYFLEKVHSELWNLFQYHLNRERL